MKKQQFRILVSALSALRQVRCVHGQLGFRRALSPNPRATHRVLCSMFRNGSVGTVQDDKTGLIIRSIITQVSRAKKPKSTKNLPDTDKIQNVGSMMFGSLVLKQFDLQAQSKLNLNASARQEFVSSFLKTVEEEVNKFTGFKSEQLHRCWILWLMYTLAAPLKLTNQTVKPADGNVDEQTAALTTELKQLRLQLVEALFELAKADKVYWILKCPLAQAIACYDENNERRDARILQLYKEVHKDVGNIEVEFYCLKFLINALGNSGHWRLIPGSFVGTDGRSVKVATSMSFKVIEQFFLFAAHRGQYDVAFDYLASFKAALCNYSCTNNGSNRHFAELFMNLAHLLLDSFDKDKPESKVQQLQQLSRLFEAFRDLRMCIDAKSAMEFEKRLRSVFGASLKVSTVRLADVPKTKSTDVQSVCCECGANIPRYPPQLDRFDKMRTQFMEKSLIRGNIYLRTNPVEYDQKMRFFEQSKKFSYVIDSMNILLAATRFSKDQLRAEKAQGNRHPWSSKTFERVLHKVVEHASTFAPLASVPIPKRAADWRFAVDSMKDKQSSEDARQVNILLVTQRINSMKKALQYIVDAWNSNPAAYAVKGFYPKLHLLLLDVATLDDSYAMYAAMQSGSGCFFVSNDFLHDHLNLFVNSEYYPDFKDWVEARRISVMQHRLQGSTDVMLMVPDNGISSVTTDRNTSNTSMHLPYYYDYENVILPPQRRWLCLNFKENDQ